MNVTLSSVLKAVIRRWRRNLLSIIAITAGTASVVAMLGISQATAQQVIDRVNQYSATTISISLPGSTWSSTDNQLLEGTNEIPGLLQIGTLATPDHGTSSVTIQASYSERSARAGTVIATPEGLEARGATFINGNLPSARISAKDPYAVVLGAALAKEIGVTTRPGENRFFLNTQPATAVGILRDGPHNSSLTTSLIVTPETAAHLGLIPPVRVIAVHTASGAAPTVASILPTALYPKDPEAVTMSVPPSPQQLREQLIADTESLVTIVALVMAAAASFGIVTTMQISVWERRREIGILRAMGMTKGRVVQSLMWESILLGALGAVSGYVLGVVITAAVTTLNGWTFTLPYIITGTPLIGILAGLIGGILPSASAARIDPAELLRS